MAVVCLLNPQRGVFGSPFMNNMTSDLLIRAFNLKCNKEKGSAYKQSSQNMAFIIIFWKRGSHALNRTRLHMIFLHQNKTLCLLLTELPIFRPPHPLSTNCTYPICLLFQYKSSNDNFFPSQVLLVSGLPYPSSKQYYIILQQNTAATVWELTCPPDWSV